MSKPYRAAVRITCMLIAYLLLALMAAPYFAINIRRVWRGQRWALTFCSLGRDWERRMHAENLARARLRAEAARQDSQRA